MLLTFFNKSVVVRRLRTVSGNKKAYYATSTADCTYQNLSAVESDSLEGVASKRYKAWFEIAEDVQPGDILTDTATSKQFRVLETEKLAEDMGLLTEHLEVIMERYTG
jgi:hypothetical protein